MAGAVALACALCALGTGVPATAEPAVALVVIVHPDNHVVASASDLEAWFLRKERSWPTGAPIIPINQPPDAAARHLFDKVVLGLSPDDAARYWLDQRIRSGDTAPREIADATTTIRLVARLPSAIAYVPASMDLHGVRVIARISATELALGP